MRPKRAEERPVVAVSRPNGAELWLQRFDEGGRDAQTNEQRDKRKLRVFYRTIFPRGCCPKREKEREREREREKRVIYI